MLRLTLESFWIIFLIYTPMFLFIPRFKENTKAGLNKFFIIIGSFFLVIDLIAALYVYPKIVPLFTETHLPIEYYFRNIASFIGALIISLFLIVLGWKVIKLPLKENKSFYIWWFLLIFLSFVFARFVIAGLINPIMQIPVS